jgi:hypothetical protein
MNINKFDTGNNHVVLHTLGQSHKPTTWSLMVSSPQPIGLVPQQMENTAFLHIQLAVLLWQLLLSPTQALPNKKFLIGVGLTG